MESVKIGGYGNYSNDNYGKNAMYVQIGSLTIYFSYQTPVAFSAPGIGRRVRVNSWGPTTGKHLNAIDNGNQKARINGEQFERELEKLLAEHGLTNESIAMH